MLLAGAAIFVTAYALIAPFTVVRYPPLTDLPMHAAIASALRHWLDPAWHFQDQFELAPFRSPVLTFYALAALLAFVFPIPIAMKIATVAMLSLLPIGLAVLCHAMKKNPTMGVAAAGLAFGTLTHWGFISYLGAVGLTMIGVGLTLMVVERPDRSRLAWLGAVSLLIFFTHVSRVPTYLLAVGLATAVMFPLSRNYKPVAVAIAPTAALFAVWWITRTKEQTGTIALHFDASHASKIDDWLFHSFIGSAEGPVLATMTMLVLGVAVYAVVLPVVLATRGRRVRAPSSRAMHATAAVAGVSCMHLALYFLLPDSIGDWSIVYPREIVPAVLFGLAALPGLPRDPWMRAPALCVLLMAITMPVRLVREKYVTFEHWTEDFPKLLARIPLAPKLGYVLYDRSGPDGATFPMLHFPAWVQAERGGWLSFHFAAWDTAPIHFRTTPPMDVAPPTPQGFEMHPDMFDFATRGKYFDWILIRALSSPAARVEVDPSLELVAQDGRWWLYHRTPIVPVSGR